MKLDLGGWALRSTWIRAVVPLSLVLVLGVIFNGDGAFFEWSTHRALFREIAVLGILACGMTVVIVSGGIDLSVGSLLGLAAVAFALFTLPMGLSGPAALALVTLGGVLLGSISGLLVAVGRIQAFIATLAMMVFARGLSKELSLGQKITNYVTGPDGAQRVVEYPTWFSLLDSRVLGDNVAVVTLVFAAVAALAWFVLSQLRAGRYLYAVGGNGEGAELAGVPVRKTLVFAYAFSGFCAAIAGICQAAQEMQGDPETGGGYELDSIAMVVLGGTSLAGGRGGVGLTLVGALTLGYLQKVLSLNAFSTEARLMLTGAIIVFAVLFQKRRED
jgi:ribose transport system permease protein